jgi:hypothetical protein
MTKLSLLSISLLFSCLVSVAQDRKVLDSLNNAFKKATIDTTKIVVL